MGGAVSPTEDLSTVSRHWSEKATAEDFALRPKVAWVAHPVVLREHVNRHISGDPAKHWLAHVRDRHVPARLSSGLSLGCGQGHLERSALQLGMCDHFDGFDIAEGAIEIARREAARLGWADRLNYAVTDINRIRLEQEKYDLALAAMSLHHFQELEHVFAQVEAALKPAGLFVLNEYVGPSRFQMTDKQLRIINELLQLLPPRYREFIRHPGRIKEREPREPVESIVRRDPSEAVRSDEILPLLPRHFDIVERIDYGGTILHMMLKDIVGNFKTDKEEDVAILRLLCYLERLLIEEGALPSDFALVVARKRARPPVVQASNGAVRGASCAADDRPAGPRASTGEADTSAEAQRPPDASVIIPVFNRLDLTRRCLDSVRRNTPHGRYEVIVVDNASQDGTVAFLEAEQMQARLRTVRNAENLGFSRACNLGAGAALGRYLLFLNNDTEVQPGWFEPLVDTLDADAAVAAVGSRLLFPDGTIQHAGVVIVDDRKLPDPLAARHIYYRRPGALPEANQARTYQALTAACLLVRRAAFEAVHGFDEEYWNGYEDVDLCFAMQEHGWILVYEPRSLVIHHEHQSGPERFRCVGHNVNRLHAKWLGKVRPDALLLPNGESRNTDAGRVKPYAPPEPPRSEDAWPPEVLSLVRRANECAECSDFRGACDALTQALHRLPEDPWLICTRGHVLVRMEDLAGATEEFHRCVRLHPHYAAGYAGLGVVLGRLDQAGEAAAALRKAVELDPTDEAAATLLAGLPSREAAVRE